MTGSISVLKCIFRRLYGKLIFFDLFCLYKNVSITFIVREKSIIHNKTFTMSPGCIQVWTGVEAQPGRASALSG